MENLKEPARDRDCVTKKSKSLLERIEELESNVPLISRNCDGEANRLTEDIMNIKKFIGMGLDSNPTKGC